MATDTGLVERGKRVRVRVEGSVVEVTEVNESFWPVMGPSGVLGEYLDLGDAAAALQAGQRW